ncbi:MAG: DUF4377 domain-containing protein [Prevotella sp.]|nr:DUF4377 domain-containing protein [Prevotella sp.]
MSCSIARKAMTAFWMIASISFAGCSDDENIVIVASERSYACGYDGVVRPHYLIKEGEKGTWKRASIFGLHWEEGYEYRVEVKDVSDNNCDPVDEVSLSYEVTEVVGKTKKQSSDLPKLLYNEEWPEGITCEEAVAR